VTRRLLITGGAGFIGANFTRYWAGAYPGDRLVVLDKLTYAGNKANLAPLLADRVRFVLGDIADRALVGRLLNEERIDTIVNFAAESHVDRSIDDPGSAVHTNVLGTQSLLDAARSCWHAAAERNCHFHHVSTDEVYGSLGPGDPPFTERHPYCPNSPYAASKAAADHLVRAYGTTYGLRYTISNCSNNYGPFQFPEKLIPLCLVNLLEGRTLPLYGDGQQIRDWLHVHDHCRAIECILTRATPGTTWNVGGGTAVENVWLIGRLCESVEQAFARAPALGERFPNCPAARQMRCVDRVRFVPDRPGHDRRYTLDAGRIERELGFRTSIALDQGLAATVDWYLDNASWWREVKDGTYRRGLAAEASPSP
jgi:dTDP-glucose 4,6-dehydratase